ncbi:MAG TPA: DUF721 domain-containing protein [Acidobacteriota bacterium]|jgi:hypothetical protein|nr:DUF721 domain-containing protein [Acidobacteriota bacterium]HNR39843.1 DUF721 domain-containing protein [Acidobacteriota bacterium]HNU02047.1 DUF721 domain-containing protein [Acidobacteriota bacterium]HPB28278.1 DUF721 domain-containing protein [Acidobacteriota bacterium]HQO26121.1 DUF721 domain-containing protein [Acidobacteriota bacterium]
MRMLQEILTKWAASGDVLPVFYAGLLGGIWPRLVGDRLAPLSRPGELADGVLVVHVKNRYWKTQLETLEAEIVRRIADFIPPGVVQRVVLRVSPERFPDRLPQSRRRPTTPAGAADPAWIDRCAAAIDNPRLREAFTRALTASLRE